MGAVRGLGLTPGQAAVRALRAGADMVLVDPGGPTRVVDAVTSALRDGRYSRTAAVRSARRVLALKRTTNPPRTPSSLAPADGARATGGLSALLRDPVPGTDTAQFWVRSAGSPTWDVAQGGRASAAAGSRATYRPRLRPGTAYEWRVRSCNSAGRCSATSRVLRFTTPATPPATATATTAAE
ncbi:MAG: hypothetical protein JWM64_2876 [Frankiales bacterium]|nr:hypothetical protein [Frankiales bacterium]